MSGIGRIFILFFFGGKKLRGKTPQLNHENDRNGKSLQIGDYARHEYLYSQMMEAKMKLEDNFNKFLFMNLLSIY